MIFFFSITNCLFLTKRRCFLFASEKQGGVSKEEEGEGEGEGEDDRPRLLARRCHLLG